ncbi:serine/threonine-protein kinase SBK2 [Alligator mississippiensis]|uniref:serine/threonine-protein kinase SBK2 n=1 Tax=Alligator mississippiensis TaxID=8496 RepID=UPI0028774CBF|nr:serine/threonine-protein kinase SBK2 [Alligator mississippiensis]
MNLLPAKQCLEEMVLLTEQNLPQVKVQESYTILQELGSGAYGHVLLAMHQQQGTPMALKFIGKQDTELRGFLSEYCISLSLSAHPCIVGALGIAFQTDHHYVFAQEIALSKDLLSILHPQGGYGDYPFYRGLASVWLGVGVLHGCGSGTWGLFIMDSVGWGVSAVPGSSLLTQVGIPEVQVKRCALQISSALEFMGNKGLVHRDIKPENVLLFDPECRRVKLTDFGLSCPRGTAIEALPENLPYTAPELCCLSSTDHLPAQPSLDAWALGVLLFCTLTGYFPWHTATDQHHRKFEKWHRSPRIHPCPPRWERFTPEALEMLRGLLTPDSAQRSPPTTIMSCIKHPWLKPKEQGAVGGGRIHVPGRPVGSRILLGRSWRC